MIEGLIKFLGTIYTTPNILTEVSNLGGKLPKPQGFFNTLKVAVSCLEEEYCASRNAVAETAFDRLGLTDAGILHIAAKGRLVLTTDLALYQMLVNKGIVAVNLNHIRPQAWVEGFRAT